MMNKITDEMKSEMSHSGGGSPSTKAMRAGKNSFNSYLKNGYSGRKAGKMAA